MCGGKEKEKRLQKKEKRKNTREEKRYLKRKKQKERKAKNSLQNKSSGRLPIEKPTENAAEKDGDLPPFLWEKESFFLRQALVLPLFFPRRKER